MLNYPITVTSDPNGTLQVGFPDVPLAAVSSQDREDVLSRAKGALEHALELCIGDGRPVPLPSRTNNDQPGVLLGALPTAKILLWNAMLASDIGIAELARRLGRPIDDVERLFELERPTDISLIEKAANALGKRVEIQIA
ncbi:type II toxin-antitoxin system HicB family antitoxin [Massilia horti]|uniref:Type II toxin-antitoxin system HicB family antitoxin n=1 Tax=Massilia horti TaxID=2562153 RepID=A0A4Y9SQ30_9BURK|nr:type II toxin-antitoxin system HicB family antitoxin [Massilia horti]TFW27344.1 type II toxin-antitoxin system HicB family antitoxin [Massilia horti]